MDCTKIQKICTFCEESFPFDVIKDHIRINHLGFESSNDDAESLEHEIQEELDTNLNTNTCNMCNIGFPNKFYLRKHLENFHFIKQKTQETEIESSDDSDTESEQSLDDHEIQEEVESSDDDALLDHEIQDQNPNTCTMCNIGFPNKSYLNVHLENFHFIKQTSCSSPDDPNDPNDPLLNQEEEKPMNVDEKENVQDTELNVEEPKCDICERKFRSLLGLRFHMRSMHDQVYIPNLICDICNKEYTNTSELNRHKKNVHGPKDQSCEVCGKFFSRSKLNDHQRQAHKKFKCDLCDKEFSYSSLAQHKKWVHGGYKESCEVCGMTFFSLSGLQSHKKLKNHQTPKPPKEPKPKIRKVKGKVNCDICHKEVSSTYIRSHMKFVHGNFKLNCEKCDKSFKCKSSLDEHMKKIHDDTYVKTLYYCEHCEKSYCSKDYFEKHSCNPTYTNFAYKYNLQSQQKSYTCGECKKYCSTKEHLMNHLCISNMDTYECGDCLKVFSSEAGLKVHQRNFHKEYLITAL